MPNKNDNKGKYSRLEKEAKKAREEKISIPNVLPAIAMRSNMVIFPNTVVPFYVGREISLMALEEAMEKTNQIVFVVNQKDPAVETPTEKDLYKVGTIVRIIQVGKLPDETFKVLVEGIARAKWIKNVGEKFFKFEIEILRTRYGKSKRLIALMRMVKEELHKYVQYSRKIPPETLMLLEDVDNPDVFADIAASLCPGNIEEKQQLLEIVHPANRLERILDILARETELLEIEQQLDQKVKERIEKSQREYYLREKLRVIRDELGGEEDIEIKELKEKIENNNYPEFVKEKARAEINRLEKMSPYAPEATVVRTYLDWILNLPWHEKTDDTDDINFAEKVLNEDHYGLDEPKRRILEYLATRKVSQKAKAPIICFVGPPGVGKTSLAKSIARAMNRKFGRMSLGGLRDEAEIRGHRRTYVGAMPGRIMQLIRKLGVKNPVILLDEIDKMGISFQGDPASALLEVLDPEQNKEFVDHYIELPYDLSEVLFVTTANVLYTIPPALRDRMEVIEISSYTDVEKFYIAKNYIIPKIESEFVEKADEIFSFKDTAIKKIINEYTLEPGVRELEREIRSVVRKATLDAIKTGKKIVISPEKVTEYLGPSKIKDEDKLEKPMIGVTTGLAWTPNGGTTLYIESTLIPGNGGLIITGQLGDVMKESVRIALSLARKIVGDEYAEKFTKNDIHVHVPEGAVPKDGPSAGVTITTALVSVVKNIPVRNDIAMTGEITLRGRVLPVGGIKEKVMAAYRKGIYHVILPKKNEVDIEKVPEVVRTKMKFTFVETIEEVLEVALNEDNSKESRKGRTRKGNSNTK
ncbi:MULTISPECIES: endopeptidase La [Fervidobacterium]|uniref:Lon protease n=1 Tax=Fervidobacterium nodosum (strain ATCC 35602 / DSM 5306 / Rt17-B1) TaxID=381764 RepID=LON_FERNB|nr:MULTISPECIES: endopeptidase La [Fervidobacterium]A7HK39.1 RecName: Full=Lon protease; AltName: Full=ATP-dependent protease La [Fervidobacterium nodosum Rt17-B1]ABS60272.1 ATP-dependent protease La [Fervidobacterium nodosum Rt17-B1]KAF2961448.1 DNA-binding protein [Fervidobacterium sp. 2310opik-2]PHJ14354.1 DNA-binding protein [Fervidobacterium sp. SC_NGM5_G05]